MCRCWQWHFHSIVVSSIYGVLFYCNVVVFEGKPYIVRRSVIFMRELLIVGQRTWNELTVYHYSFSSFDILYKTCMAIYY
jgi:hypothetical protein